MITPPVGKELVRATGAMSEMSIHDDTGNVGLARFFSGAFQTVVGAHAVAMGTVQDHIQEYNEAVKRIRKTITDGLEDATKKQDWESVRTLSELQPIMLKGQSASFENLETALKAVENQKVLAKDSLYEVIQKAIKTKMELIEIEQKKDDKQIDIDKRRWTEVEQEKLKLEHNRKDIEDAKSQKLYESYVAIHDRNLALAEGIVKKALEEGTSCRIQSTPPSYNRATGVVKQGTINVVKGKEICPVM